MSNKAMFEFFMDGEEVKPNIKEYHKADERAVMINEYAGGPKIMPERKARKEIDPVYNLTYKLFFSLTCRKQC